MAATSFRSPHRGARLPVLYRRRHRYPPEENIAGAQRVRSLNCANLNDALDALREPIRIRSKIHLSRTRAKITYPAGFQLIAAMNPSPTGRIRKPLVAARQNRHYVTLIGCQAVS